jgi:hypothetical protein
LVEVVVYQTWDSSTPGQIHDPRRRATCRRCLLIGADRNEAAVADCDRLDSARGRVDCVDAPIPQDEVSGLGESGPGPKQKEREDCASETRVHANLPPSSRNGGAGEAHGSIVRYVEPS